MSVRKASSTSGGALLAFEVCGEAVEGAFRRPAARRCRQFRPTSQCIGCSGENTSRAGGGAVVLVGLIFAVVDSELFEIGQHAEGQVDVPGIAASW